MLHDLLGEGIFNSDGEAWRVQRKVASRIFHVKNFRDRFTRYGRSSSPEFLIVLLLNYTIDI